MIRKIFFPKIDDETRTLMDQTCTKSIENISLVVAVFEAFTLALFVLTRRSFGSEEWTSIYSVLFCIVTCFAGYLCSKIILDQDTPSHYWVTALNVCYYMLMTLWSIWSSRRRYENGEQILTVYAVDIMLVCFIVLRPWVSVIMTIIAYGLLYLILYQIDGAAGIHIINFHILMIISAVGMVVRYHSILKVSKATIQLRETKDSEIKDKIEILKSIADIYDKVNIIDFVENTEMSVRDSDQIKYNIDPVNQTHTVMSTRIRERVMPDQLESFINFTNIRTVRNRLVGKKLISDDFIDVVEGWFRAQYIPVEVDENGVPFRVVFTTRNVDDEKRREERLVRIAMTDELTRLFNRRSYEEDLAEYNTKEMESDFVVLSADVNGLKRVNDTMGHAGGDELIKGAAECLLLGIGSRGKVYRTGGDEFVAILHTDAPGEICQNIEKFVENWHGMYSKEMSISLGYASRSDNPDLGIHDLEKKADDEMYRAKAAYYEKKGIDRRSAR